ncbi:hypothetical protein BGX38DRAFT_1332071, partial [Terfezia claveryi]
ANTQPTHGFAQPEILASPLTEALALEFYCPAPSAHKEQLGSIKDWGADRPLRSWKRLGRLETLWRPVSDFILISCLKKLSSSSPILGITCGYSIISVIYISGFSRAPWGDLATAG